MGNTTTLGGNAGEMGDKLEIVNLGVGRTAISLTLGDHHACVILDNEDLKCWGYNTNGQLGIEIQIILEIMLVKWEII